MKRGERSENREGRCGLVEKDLGRLPSFAFNFRVQRKTMLATKNNV